jgi:predicted membrane channel-forming protein YqfA (hemolysin III family)
MYYYKRDYIKYGYRSNPHMTVKKCTKTIFMCHCETGNIWTHIAASIYFLVHLILILVRYIELVTSHQTEIDGKLNDPSVQDLKKENGNYKNNLNPYTAYNTTGSLVSQGIGALSIIFTFTASWIYHAYSALSQKWAIKLLRVDLIGIAVMIFTMNLVSVYIGFHAHSLARNTVMIAMFSIAACNLFVQMTPCYNEDRFDTARTLFYVVIIAICLFLAFYWYFCIASDEEANLYTLRLAMSFVYLGIGFWFYSTKYPEKIYKRSRFV